MSSESEPSKIEGQYKSLKGTATEVIGNMTGAESWVESGKKEHAEGEAECKAAAAKGYAEGTIDRATGKIDSVVGAITGDKEQQGEGNLRNEKGQAQQEMNKNL